MFYPLQFEPLLQYRLWGGDKLQKVLGKKDEGPSMGESWEISAVRGMETTVLAGALQGMTIQQLIAQYGATFLGGKVLKAHGEEFPLLIKFIDAARDLSIQVHPDDALAAAYNGDSGKTEMWYIMDSDPSAHITIGFKEELDREQFKKHIGAGTVEKVLNRISVQKGDAFHIPAGRIHAIGGGTLLAEIQQSSDLTYRVYDYDRIDERTGNKRELHIEPALDAIDFNRQDSYRTNFKKATNRPNDLIANTHFTTQYLAVEGGMSINLEDRDSFSIYMGVGGAGHIMHNDSPYTIKEGSCLLVPACIPSIEISGSIQLLEVFL